MFPVAHVSVPVLYLASLSKHSLGTGLAQSEGNPSCPPPPPPPTIGIRLHPHRIRRWHHSQQGCTGVGGAGEGERGGGGGGGGLTTITSVSQVALVMLRPSGSPEVN